MKAKFIKGIVVGLAAGILLAPDKGSETRRKIVDKGKGLAGKGKELAASAKEKVREKVSGFADEAKKSLSKKQDNKGQPMVTA